MPSTPSSRAKAEARTTSFQLMRIAVYGEMHSPGSGSWCYSESLAEMGVEVIRIDDTDGLAAYYRDFAARAVRRLLGRPLEHHRRRHAATAVAAVVRAKPDVVIVLKGLHIAAGDVDAMRSTGAWVVNINHDDFFSENPNNWSRAQREAIPRYDFIFATRAQNVDELRPLNPRVGFLPFAYYPRIHRAVPIADAERGVWESDVVFVGTWERERCDLLEHLVTQVPARYSIWGNQWERISRESPLRPYVRGRAAMMDDMCKAIGGAKVALAFLRKANRDAHTLRTFEIPACGGVLLAERTPQHLDFFREGAEAEFFDASNASELVSKTRLLLDNDAHRETLRHAGHAALLRQRHTYKDRLEQLLGVFASTKRGEQGR